MTKVDQEKTIANLQASVADLKRSNQEFQNALLEQIKQLGVKVETPLKPFELQDSILAVVQRSMTDCIKATLTGYTSPLTQLVQCVVNEHSEELKVTIREAFGEVIRTEDFKRAIVSGFAHKVARSIVAGNDSMFEKVTNEMKQDATFKSKMTLAVAQVVEEIIRERKA